jgi:hypothetical protein
MVSATLQYNTAKSALEGYKPTTPGPMVTGRSETAQITAEARAQAEHIVAVYEQEYEKLQKDVNTILGSIGKTYDPLRGIVDNLETKEKKTRRTIKRGC